MLTVTSAVSNVLAPVGPLTLQALYTHCVCDGSTCQLSFPQMTTSRASPRLPSLPPTLMNIRGQNLSVTAGI